MDSTINRDKNGSKTIDETQINRTMGVKSEGPHTPGYKGYQTILAKSPNREVYLRQLDIEENSYGRMSSIVSELTARASDGKQISDIRRGRLSPILGVAEKKPKHKKRRNLSTIEDN